MKTATQRTFTDVETGYKFRLYTSHDNSKHYLIAEGQPEKIADGCEVNGWYIAAHCGATIKINGKKQIFVNQSQFYNLKEGEEITHRKFVGFNKFTKM